MADLSTRSPAGLLKDYIIRYFTAQNVSLTGWTWALGKLPASPDQVITFIDQSGPAGFPHLLLEWPGLQVLVRGSRGGTGYNDSYLMMRKIRDGLLGVFNAPPEFTELTGILERGTIVPIGYDESDRHTWSCNFQLRVEPEANVLTHRTSL